MFPTNGTPLERQVHFRNLEELGTGSTSIWRVCEHAGQSGRKQHRATERQSAKWTETRPGRPSDRPSDRQEQNKQQGPDLPLAVFGCLLGLRPRKPGRRRSPNSSPESMRRPTITRTARDPPRHPKGHQITPKTITRDSHGAFLGRPLRPTAKSQRASWASPWGPPWGTRRATGTTAQHHPAGPPHPDPAQNRKPRRIRATDPNTRWRCNFAGPPRAYQGKGPKEE